MRVACRPKETALLLLALAVSAAESDGGLLEGVEVVTSTSVSVRVSTSEDHVPRESVINHVVEKEKTQSNARGTVTKMSAPKGVMKEDQQGTSRVATQGQSVTISALGPSTESPKFRVRHKSGSTLPTAAPTLAEATTIAYTTTASPSAEAPKEAPRRKRKRPAGYRRPMPEGQAPQQQTVPHSGPILPRRSHRPEQERKHSQVRPHQQFAQNYQPQQEKHQPPQQEQQQQQHVELNHQPQLDLPQQASPSPAQLPSQYQTPPPRHEAIKPFSVPAPVPALASQQDTQQQSEAHPIMPALQYPLPSPPSLKPVAPVLPPNIQHPTDQPQSEAVPTHQPQVRPRPVQFQPQLHNALPIPRPVVTPAQNPPKVVPVATAEPPSPPTHSLVHSNQPQVHLPILSLPAVPSSHQEPVPLPPVPIKKIKPHKAKKQHRAPDNSVKHAPITRPIVQHPVDPLLLPPTLPPPTIPKHTATTAKSSFLSYFSFGKKDEIKPPEPVPVPLPLTAPTPGVQQQHQQNQYQHYHRQHAAIDPYQSGAAELPFKEMPVKPQKFPKTTKSQKQSKLSKKHHSQQFETPRSTPAQGNDEYPIPPAVPIPPPKYDEPHRHVEAAQPTLQTTVTSPQTSYTPPPALQTTRDIPQTTFQQTTHYQPVETQRPYHHAPSYTPSPMNHLPSFLFGYQHGQQPPQQLQQVQYHHLSPPQHYQQQQQHHHSVNVQHSHQQAKVPEQFPQQPTHPHANHHAQPQQQIGQQLIQTFSQQVSQQRQQQQQQQSHQQPQALLVQMPQNVNPSEQIELPAEMLKALGVKSVAPGVQKPTDSLGQSPAPVVGHLSNGKGVVVLDEASNRPYVRPNTAAYHASPEVYGSPVAVDVSKTPFTKGIPHGFPAPSKIQVDEKTQVSLSGVVLSHDGGLKTTYSELPPTQVNLNEPLNVHIPISQLPPRPAVNVRIKGPDGKVSEVLVPLHESNVKNGGFQLPPIGGLIDQAAHESNGSPKKYIPTDYYTSGKPGRSHHRLPVPYTQAFVPSNHQSSLFASPSNPFLHYANPTGQTIITSPQDPLQAASSSAQSSWIGGWGHSIRSVGSRVGSIFSRKALSS